jgi:hypothetical protein
MSNSTDIPPEVLNIIQNLQEQVNLLTQQQQQYQQQQQHPVPILSRAVDPKIPDVALFNGKRKELKAFLTQLEIKFAAQPITYSTDGHRIAYTASRLSDGPLEWAAPLLRAKRFVTVEDLFTQLQATFGDHEEVANSRTQLLKLKQGTKSCAAFTTEFIRLASQTKWDESTFLGIYTNGLTEDLQYALSLVDQPDNFDKFSANAIRTDNRLFARRQAKGRTNYPERLPNTLSPQSTTPMEIDAITASTTRPPFKRLSQEEKDRRSREGLCVYCAGQHALENCTIRPKNGQPRRH